VTAEACAGVYSVVSICLFYPKGDRFNTTLLMGVDQTLKSQNATSGFSRSCHVFAPSPLWRKSWGLHAWGATYSHIGPLPSFSATHLFSQTRLRRKDDFREIVRLPWAQEARGSNPCAPTSSLQINSLQPVGSPRAAIWCSWEH
jgi:hypothetical protein